MQMLHYSTLVDCFIVSRFEAARNGLRRPGILPPPYVSETHEPLGRPLSAASAHRSNAHLSLHDQPSLQPRARQGSCWKE